MLRISKLTDYGIIAATHLAGLETPASVRDLAELTTIAAPTVSKVLKSLCRAGVVRSVRGARGGYLLTRPAEKITVVEVIEALDGPIAVTECTDEDTSCSHAVHCNVRTNWQRINDAVLTALGSISLADMTGPDLAASELVTLALDRQDAQRTRMV